MKGKCNVQLRAFGGGYYGMKLRTSACGRPSWRCGRRRRRSEHCGRFDVGSTGGRRWGGLDGAEGATASASPFQLQRRRRFGEPVRFKFLVLCGWVLKLLIGAPDWLHAAKLPSAPSNSTPQPPGGGPGRGRPWTVPTRWPNCKRWSFDPAKAGIDF